MELIRRRERSAVRKQRGMTLIELMIAMMVLLVGVVGSLSLVAVSMGGDGRSRQQSSSTVISQMVTEKISSVNANLNQALTITDCNGTNHTVDTAAGGASLLASGTVDFTQNPPANYSMFYTECGTGGRQFVYDVRWNVQSLSPYEKLLTVSAKLRNGATDLRYFSLPVTITTLIGEGN